jgi:hypothetical protein
MALTERRTFVADRSGCVWGPGTPPDPTTHFRLKQTAQGTYLDGTQLGMRSGVLEVLITELRPTKWEWRVCDRHGTVWAGFESTRPAAKYRGNWALFLRLPTRWAR